MRSQSTLTLQSCLLNFTMCVGTVSRAVPMDEHMPNKIGGGRGPVGPHASQVPDTDTSEQTASPTPSSSH